MTIRSTEPPAPALRPVTPPGIIAARLSRVLALAEGLGLGDDPRAAAAELMAELTEATALAAGFEPYIEASTTPASPALAAVARRTREYDWGRASATSPAPLLEAEMLSGHVEGRFLQFLVAMSGARTVLEIGMFTGYSALAIAEALDDDGHLTACEIDPTVAALARESFDASPAGARITVRVGPARETLSSLADHGERFELIFVDADKPAYLEYVSAILDLGLLASGGTICVDNTLLGGEPWGTGQRSANGSAIAAFNAAIAADERVEQVLVPLRDGVTLIRRRR